MVSTSKKSLLRSFSFVIFILNILGSEHCFAIGRGFLDYSSTRKRIMTHGYFLAPNERFPQHLRPVLADSAPGVYVTVGTERGFIGTTMSGADYLFLFDIDLWAVYYNRATILLLR